MKKAADVAADAAPAKRRSRTTGGVKGSKPTKPRAGSLNSKLAGIELGGYLYLEIEPCDEQELRARVQRLQATVHAPMRYTGSMKGMRFKVAAYTAVRATLGDVRVLVRVERIA